MKLKKIKEAIEAMNSNEILNLNNRYCDLCNMGDDYLYENTEEFLDENFNSPSDLVRSLDGQYNFNHNYVKFNGYGNLESMAYLDETDLVDSLNVIAEYIHENFNEFEDLF